MSITNLGKIKSVCLHHDGNGIPSLKVLDERGLYLLVPRFFQNEPLPSWLTNLRYSQEKQEITVRYRQIDQEFSVLLPKSTAFTNDDRLVGKTILYLDQNMWVYLSQSEYTPEKLTPDQIEAWNFIKNKILDGHIVLPLSESHLYETVKIGDIARRVRLANTMLKFSNGCKMMHPREVARREFDNLIISKYGLDVTPSPVNVFSYDPYSYLSPERLEKVQEKSYNNQVGNTLGSRITALERLHTAISFGAFLVDEDTTNNKEFAKFLVDEAEERNAFLRKYYDLSKKRVSASEIASNMLLGEIMLGTHSYPFVKYGISLKEYKSWLESHTIDDFLPYPFIGTLAKFIESRTKSKYQSWEDHDYFDMQYLPLASAYADIVLGEKTTTNIIKVSRDITHSNSIVSSSVVEVAEKL